MRLLIIALLFAQVRVPGPGGLAPGSGSPTWSFIQEKRNEACTGGTACAVTVAGIGAGNLLVAAMITGSSLLLSSVSGDTNAFTHCGGGSNSCNANGGAGNVDASYLLSAAGGETTLTCNRAAGSDGGFYACRIYEFHYSSGTATFDAANKASGSTCTSCTGVALTISTNDVIVTTMAADQTLSAISGAYTQGQDFTDGIGSAGAMNTSVGTAPTWTQAPTGTTQAFALAIQLH
jgi:hypothetical protein